MRTLVIRIPLQDSDPFDVIAEIDKSNINLVELIEDRYDDVLLNVETGDKVHS
jgi:hypothetical protein